MLGEWTGLFVFAISIAIALGASSAASGSATEDDPLRARVQRAFARTFLQPGVRRVELRIERRGRLVARRVFEAAHASTGDVSQTLVRFVEPEYLRGHALLVVDTGSGSADTWLYQPDERRPRRIGTRQKADSFFGSDLTFEDLERPRWEQWRLTDRGAAIEAGLACQQIEALPPDDSQYARLLLWIDPQRDGVARIDFFREADVPQKRMRIDLSAASEEAGFLRVPRLVVEAVGREARTELAIPRMRIDPALAARVFSATRLEREGEDLFGLAERGAAGGTAP